MQVTVHRAVDAAADPLAAPSRSLVDSRVRRVLTSGGAADCRAGRDVLGRMVAELHGSRSRSWRAAAWTSTTSRRSRPPASTPCTYRRVGARRGGEPAGPGRRRDRVRCDGCAVVRAAVDAAAARHDDDRGARATRGATGAATRTADHQPARRSASSWATSITAGTFGAPRRLAARHRRPRAPVRRSRSSTRSSCCLPLQRWAASRAAPRSSCVVRSARIVGGAHRRADRRRAALAPGAVRARGGVRRRALDLEIGGRGSAAALAAAFAALAAAAASARRLAARARAPALRARTRAGSLGLLLLLFAGFWSSLLGDGQVRGLARLLVVLGIAGVLGLAALACRSVRSRLARPAALDMVGHGAPQRVDRGRDARRGRPVCASRPCARPPRRRPAMIDPSPGSSDPIRPRVPAPVPGEGRAWRRRCRPR